MLARLTEAAQHGFWDHWTRMIFKLKFQLGEREMVRPAVEMTKQVVRERRRY